MHRVVHADAIITGDGDVLADGAVVVDALGMVVEIGQAGEVLPRHAGAPIERVRGLVFPGLVNAHAHLELSALRGKVQGGRGFVPWVQSMLPVRAELAPEEDADAIAVAVDELWSFGTAAVGDVTNTLAAVRALARRGIGGSVFHEAFGVKLEAARARLARLEEDLAAFGAWPTADLAYAPAPHTLYTTHPEVVRALLERARARGARTTLHLAEHAAERRAIESGDGPVAEWFTKNPAIGPMPWPRTALFDLAEQMGALAPDVLLVHLTEARAPELEKVARAGAPAVFCPRSNLFIELRLPPLIAAREAGIEAALGTDSLASNASLDVLAEARALHDRFPAVAAKELVRMATWNGARALRRADLGRIAKGARPGIVAVDAAPGDDACATLLRQVKAPRRWIVERRNEA